MITKVIDPWGGSYFMEKLTQQLYDEALEIIKEVENEGGMSKAIESGMPKRKILESATKRQAKIDSKEEVIVGVNKYISEEVERIKVLQIDNQ